MRALELFAEVDDEQRLQLTLPASAAEPGRRVRVLVLLPEEAAESETDEWTRFVVPHAWAAELADEREDIYTSADGEPVNASR